MADDLATPHVETPPMRRSCGTMPMHEMLLRSHPEYMDARAKVENNYFQSLRLGLASLRVQPVTVPVIVHVVHHTAAQDISDAQIQSQIDVLNRDFAAKNTDLNTAPAPFQGLASAAGIQFALAKRDPAGQPTSGVIRTQTPVVSFGQDNSVKFTAQGGSDAWPADRYLNIWVCPLGGGLLGYAQFPGGPAATDGVVILHSAFGCNGTATSPFDLGRTTTHEVGHWLNLRHIWGDDGNGCSGDDYVGDTPNCAGPNYGKPAFPHVSCSNAPDGDLFVNFMDYVDDAAMVLFTAGQVARMQICLQQDRSSIGSDPSLI